MCSPLMVSFAPLMSSTYQTLFLSVLTVKCIVQDGKSNWLNGMILVRLYIIIAVTLYFYPGKYVRSFFSCSYCILRLTCRSRLIAMSRATLHDVLRQRSVRTIGALYMDAWTMRGPGL